MTTRMKGSTIWTEDFLGYVNILNRGAVSGGIVDCTQAFIDSLATGLPVYVPAGTFLSGAFTVPANAILFGCGAASIIKAKNALAGALIAASSGAIIDLLCIDGNKAGQVSQTAHAIQASAAPDAIVRNCVIQNVSGDGVNASGNSTAGVKVLNTTVTNFTRNGITFEDGYFNVAQNNTIWPSDGAASPGIGIALAPTNAGALITDALITGNRIRNSAGRGIAVLGFGGKNVQDCTVTHNRIRAATSHGIHLLNTQRNIVTENGVVACGGDGIRLEGDVLRCRVGMNALTSNTGTSLREVTSGASPDYNGLIYNVAQSNGSDTVVKVGANSFIV